jgi:PAS domain S-box-containing protein
VNLQKPQETGKAFAITLMEHLVVATFVLDPKGKVLIWNKACERMTGIRADEVIGTHDHWRAFYDESRPCLADLLLKDDWQTIDKLYSTFDDPSTPVFGVHAENWCVMPRRGERLYLAVNAGPVFDDAGQLIAVVETLNDITEKKQAETKVLEQATILQVHYEAQEREAEMARNILEHQIRRDLMEQSGVKFSVIPATNFSGDMVLAARSPNGLLYAFLADATGHGLAAAVSVLPIVHEFYRLVELNTPLANLVDSINFVLVNSLPMGRFVAGALLSLDQQAGYGEAWVGGTPDVLMLDDQGQLLQRLPSRCLPLGVVSGGDVNTEIQRFEWTNKAYLLTYSDGVTEASNTSGESFDENRLLAALSHNDSSTAIESVRTALVSHLAGAAAHDDMSLLVIDCYSKNDVSWIKNE